MPPPRRYSRILTTVSMESGEHRRAVQRLETKRRQVGPLTEAAVNSRQDSSCGGEHRELGRCGEAMLESSTDPRRAKASKAALNRDVLPVECLCPVEVMVLDNRQGRPTFWPGMVMTMFTRLFSAWFAFEVLGTIGWYCPKPTR